MATRDQVRELLRHGHDYETAGRELGLSPGLAFLIATGLPSDASDSRAFDEPPPAGLPMPSSPQRLAEPPPFNPTAKEHVGPWVRARAARDLRGAR